MRWSAALLMVLIFGVARTAEDQPRPHCDPAAMPWDRLVVPGDRIGPLRLDGKIEDIVKLCGPGTPFVKGGPREPQLFSTLTWDAISLWVQFDETSRNIVWISVAVGGSNPWSQYGTSDGIRLGVLQRDLVSAMGPPERTVTAGGLTSLYYDSRGIRFTLADTGPFAGRVGSMRVVWRSVPQGDTVAVPGQRISSIEIGMPLERALAGLGGGYHKSEAGSGEYLYYWPHLGLALLEHAGFVRSVRAGRQKAADAPEIRYATVEGVGQGSSAAQIKNVFGERPKANTKAPDDERWWILRSRGIAFWLDNEGKVGRIDVFAPAERRFGNLLVVFNLVVVLVVIAVFLRTLSTTLRLTRPHHGASPWLVWLMYIPIFNLGWQFYLLSAATKGITGRFRELGQDPGDAGFGVGLASGTLVCFSAVVSRLAGRADGEMAQLVTGLLLLGTVGTWVAYWVRLARFNRVMRAAVGAMPQPPPLAPNPTI